MAHLGKKKTKIVGRINRIKGQLDAVAKLLDDENSCYQVMQVLGSCRGALNGLMQEVMEGHIESHIIQSRSKGEAERAGEELAEILKSFWR